MLLTQYGMLGWEGQGSLVLEANHEELVCVCIAMCLKKREPMYSASVVARPDDVHEIPEIGDDICAPSWREGQVSVAGFAERSSTIHASIRTRTSWTGFALQ